MKNFLIVLIAVIIILLSFLAYMGVFSTISIEEKTMGPFTYAYIEHIGPYSGVGEPMAELYEKMEAADFNSTDGIGIYYDDPKKTPAAELRSEVGSIIAPEDIDKIEKNSDKFSFNTIEEKKYLVAEFPIKNIMSYMLGPMKVYPAFNEYLVAKDIEVPTKGIEYYDMTNKQILFMMEIE